MSEAYRGFENILEGILQSSPLVFTRGFCSNRGSIRPRGVLSGCRVSVCQLRREHGYLSTEPTWQDPRHNDPWIFEKLPLRFRLTLQGLGFKKALGGASEFEVCIAIGLVRSTVRCCGVRSCFGQSKLHEGFGV